MRCWQRCAATKMLIRDWQEGKMLQKNCLAVSSKVKYILTLWLSSFPPGFLSRRNLCTWPHGNLYVNIYSSCSQNIQKFETIHIHLLVNAETNYATRSMKYKKLLKKKKKEKCPTDIPNIISKALQKVKETRPKKGKIPHNSIICLSGKGKTISTRKRTWGY